MRGEGWNQKDAAASVLVTGTAIGGGFLALPYTSAPSGFVPSAVVMLVSWALLLFQAHVVTDLVVDESRRAGRVVSYATLAERRLGSGGRAVLSSLFLLLMMATLVSQFAKAGSLLAALTGLPEAGLSAALAVGLATLTWKSSSNTTASVNGLLTLGFMAACAVLFATGVPLADWSRLSRTNWSVCLPSFPTILQLFVYLEVIPTLGTILKLDPHRMKRAVLVGSVLLLILELAWSGLGLGLVPFVQGLRADPVDVLLGRGGLVSAAVLVLGCCAVCTTILGTNLALRSFLSDGVPKRVSAFAFVATSVLPAVASLWPNAFFGAIDFAGAYPVTLLWGCAPPLMALAKSKRLSGTQTTLLKLILLASVVSVTICAAQDIGRFLGLQSVAARWA